MERMPMVVDSLSVTVPLLSMDVTTLYRCGCSTDHNDGRSITAFAANVMPARAETEDDVDCAVAASLPSGAMMREVTRHVRSASLSFCISVLMMTVADPLASSVRTKFPHCGMWSGSFLVSQTWR